ncbi:MAG: T9SS C-terminal target domain-containing protein, partial [Calditrichaeota bacterium]
NLSGRDDTLPVELSAFSVSAEPGKMVLEWTTQSEINNLGFEVYRSRQREGNYDRIASYESDPTLEGAGNSNVAHHYRYADEAVEAGVTYWYKIADVDFRGMRTFHGPVSATAVASLPENFALHPNFPNPFNPATQIPFDVPPTQGHPWWVALVIYNALGQKVRTLFTGIIEPGRHQLVWDGLDDFGTAVPSGIYFVQFQGEQFVATRKLILLR